MLIAAKPRSDVAVSTQPSIGLRQSWLALSSIDAYGTVVSVDIPIAKSASAPAEEPNHKGEQYAQL